MIADAAGPALWALWLIVAVTMIPLSAIYAAGETSIYVMNKVRLDLRAESGSRPARLLRRLLDDPNNLLAVLLIGNNLSIYLVTVAVSAMFVMGGAGESAEWCTLALATPLLFILGESVPKNVAQRMGDKLAYALAGPLWISHLIYNAIGLAPVITLVARAVSRLAAGRQERASPLGHDGFGAIVAEGRAAGALTHFQSIMADRVMHLPSLHLADVMIPLDKTVCVDHGASREELLDLARRTDYARYPVRDDQGNIAAVLDIYDVLLDPHRPPMQDLPKPLKLPFFMTVTDGLYHMQDARARMAVVTDDRARPVGIVTIKDLVEEIVGELQAW